MIHEVHGQLQLFSRRVALWFLDRTVFRGDGPAVLSVAKPLEFMPLPEHTSTLPTCSLEPAAAQFLIDELWRLGLRPSEAAGSAGAMAAVQKHLEDMRTLVFKGRQVTA